MVKQAYKIYGKDGHRQRASFQKSFELELVRECEQKMIEWLKELQDMEVHEDVEL